VRLRGCATGTCCGDKSRFRALMREQGDATLKQMLTARQASCDGVVDECGAFRLEGLQAHHYRF
jgi:hypothetical protein